MSASVITPEGLTGKKTARHHFPADKDPATSLTEERTRVIQRWETDEGVSEVVSGIWCQERLHHLAARTKEKGRP